MNLKRKSHDGWEKYEIYKPYNFPMRDSFQG